MAENGGLLYEPSTDKEILIGNPPSRKLVETLCDRGVTSVSVGQCVVATWSPFENIVLETIRDLGLELQIIFNKGAVMVLPAGVNKAFGLEQALKEMKLSTHNTVGIGDAENDHAFLQVCEFSAAVANALPALKEAVEMVLPADHGAGVEFLIDQICQTTCDHSMRYRSDISYQLRRMKMERYTCHHSEHRSWFVERQGAENHRWPTRLSIR